MRDLNTYLCRRRSLHSLLHICLADDRAAATDYFFDVPAAMAHGQGPV